MMNDCLKYTISPTAQNAYLYMHSSELGASAGKLRMKVAPERDCINKISIKMIVKLFGDVINISYISGMILHYTYKITNTNGKIVYVGCTKNPKHRKGQHFSKAGKFYGKKYKFEIVGEYPNEVIAKYYEEKLKRELGLKGEMGDDRFTNHKKLFKVWWREVNGENSSI